MSFEEYDALCGRLSNLDYKPLGYWPTEREINSLNFSDRNDIEYLVWLVENNPEPANEWEKKRRDYINRTLTKLIALT